MGAHEGKILANQGSIISHDNRINSTVAEVIANDEDIKEQNQALNKTVVQVENKFAVQDAEIQRLYDLIAKLSNTTAKNLNFTKQQLNSMTNKETNGDKKKKFTPWKLPPTHPLSAYNVANPMSPYHPASPYNPNNPYSPYSPHNPMSYVPSSDPSSPFHDKAPLSPTNEDNPIAAYHPSNAPPGAWGGY